MLFTRTLKLGAVAALMLPAVALAAEDKSGPYDLWLSQEGDAATYAVINEAADKSAVAEVTDGKASLVGEARAEELIAEMRDVEAGDQVFMLRKNDDGGVDIFREEAGDHDITIVTTENESVTVKIDADVEIDSDMDVDVQTDRSVNKMTSLKSEDGKKRIVIVDIDEDGVDGEEVRKKIKIRKMPEPPEPPTPPAPDEDVDVSVSSKSAYKYHWKDDEEDKRYVRIWGASAEEAREFINDLDHLSRRQKRQMRERAGL